MQAFLAPCHTRRLHCVSLGTPPIARCAFLPGRPGYRIAKRPRAATPSSQPFPGRRTLPRAVEESAVPYIREGLSLLAATTAIIPAFRRLRLSPILGFLGVGVLLGPHGLRLVKDVDELTEIADVGVVCLLFSMGLELSVERLRKLRRYVFGYGTLQVGVTTAALGLGAYGMGASFPEAVVIGSALSLSSSAFVLQLLSEKKERQSRPGVASYGVLLLQDLATVPALVLVPLLGSSMWISPSEAGAMLALGAKHVASTIGILAMFIVTGGFVMRRVFTFVAESKSSEAFTSTVLLTVLGAAWFTEQLGLPMTLGSFIAGVLLAESSFRSRILVELEPFRGLLLGLFFITTAMSMDLSLFVQEPVKSAYLISSLIFVKTAIATLSGLPIGLSLAESLRVGLLLSQGGEFAFVLFSIGYKLGFLPPEVYPFLINTVVASMALTPALYEVGMRLAPVIDKYVEQAGGQSSPEAALSSLDQANEAFVVIFGYGPVGKLVAQMLSRKFIRWIAVDISIDRVREAAALSLPVLYGDSAHPAELLEANGLPTPSAFVITHSAPDLLEECLEAVRSACPDRPVYVRAKDLNQQKKLLNQGAMAMFPESLETSLSLGAAVLEAFGTVPSDVAAIKTEMRDDGEVEKAFVEYDVQWGANQMRSPLTDMSVKPEATGPIVVDEPSDHSGSGHALVNGVGGKEEVTSQSQGSGVNGDAD